MESSSYIWAEEQVESTFDPWVDITPDSREQTGGDWYRLFLAAALGGKAVHGANTSPTCEVLCKIDLEKHRDDNYGLLTWDDTTKHADVLGKDVSDQFYVHPPYRGTITTSGSILAYESGLWEPSVRKRARSSALLAAALVVHGMNRLDACALVSRLTGEPIDIEAVDSAIIPASHLKREMVIVSKASHRIFTRGTIQSGLTWFDEKLILRTGAQNMAFDWGRITAIARYIGEANIQNCRAFAFYAKRRGIPYTVVRNSWAYVAVSDYQLPTSMFRNVPKVDLVRLGIPSLIGTFVGHEQDVMMALNRGSKFLSIVPENEAFRAYIRMHQDARARIGRKNKLRIPPTSDAHIVNIAEHSLTEAEILLSLKGGTLIRDSFIMAIASRRDADASFDTLLSRVAQVDVGECTDFSDVDEASTMMYDNQIWILARIIAESKMMTDSTEQPNDPSRIHDKITSKLSAMKANLIGYPTHIETKLHLSNTQLINLRAQTVRNAQKSGKCTSMVTYSQRTIASAQVRSTAQAMGGLTNEQEEKFRELREGAAARYEEWYTEAMEDAEENVRVNLAYFAFIHVFLSDLKPNVCFQANSAFIEGTVPRRSYVYQGVVKTASDFKFVPPKLKRLVYADAYQIANELDELGIIPYSVNDAVDEVVKIAHLVIGDLMVDKVWVPDPDTFWDARALYATPISPPYCGNMMRDEELSHMLTLRMMDLEANRKDIFATGYQACLNTYPNPTMADRYAVANGYPNLRAAYDMIGVEASYEESNQFVINAVAALAYAKASTQEADEGPSTSKKRKFDAVM